MSYQDRFKEIKKNRVEAGQTASISYKERAEALRAQRGPVGFRTPTSNELAQIDAYNRQKAQEELATMSYEDVQERLKNINTMPAAARYEYQNFAGYQNNADIDKAIAGLNLSADEMKDYQNRKLKQTITAGTEKDWNDTTKKKIGYSDRQKMYDALMAQRSRNNYDHAFDYYKDIQNNADFAENAKEDYRLDTNGAKLWNEKYKNRTLDEDIALVNRMTDEEKAVLYYLRNTDLEKYFDYLDDMKLYVNKRDYNERLEANKEFADKSKAARFAERLASTGREFISAPGATGEMLRDTLYGRNHDPYAGASGTSLLAGDMREDINGSQSTKVGQFLGGVLDSSVDSYLGASIYGPVYAPLMAGHAYNSQYRDSIEKGLDTTTATTDALMNGINEALFEKLSLDQFLHAKQAKNMAQAIKNVLLQSGIEGSEEMFTDIANRIVDDTVLKNQSEYNLLADSLREQGYSEDEVKAEVNKEFWKNVGLSGLAGALSGTGMSAVQSGIELSRYSNIGNNVNANRLSNVIEGNIKGKDADVYGEYLKLVDKYGSLEKAKNSEIGGLYYDAVNSIQKKINQTDVMDFLTEEGASAAEASALMEAALAEKPNKKQKALLNSELGQKLLSKDYMSNYVASKPSESMKELTDTQYQLANVAKTRIEKDYNVSNKTTFNGEDAKLTGLKKEGKNLIAVTDKGEAKVKDGAITLSINDAQILAIASTYNDADRANAFVANYDGRDVEDYANAMSLAYQYGKMENVSAGTLMQDLGNSGLTETTLLSMYEAGAKAKNLANQEIAKAQKELMDKYSGEFKKGTFKDELNGRKLSANEMVIYSMLETFSNGGVNIGVFYDTDADSINGEYDEKTNTIRINLAARFAKTGNQFDRRYAVSTMAHEFTHWMEANAKAEFEELKGMVWAYFEAQGIDVEKLIAKESQNGKKSREVAISEVMARACEDMFNDSDTFAQIAANQDSSTLKKIRDIIVKVFDKILSFLDDMMKGYGSNAQAATFLRQNKEAFEAVRKQWIATFNKALEYNQAINETLIPTSTVEAKASDKVELDTSLENIKGKLMAYHNLDEDSLIKAIKLGGFPMPSIAIKSAEIGHSEYGKISVIFGRNTIDPLYNKDNDIFSGDAFTPVFPSVDVKVNSKVLDSIQKKIMKLVGGQEAYYKMGGANLDISNTEDLFNRNRDASSNYGNNKTLQYAFLNDTGKGFDIPMMERKLHSTLSNDAIGAMAKVIGEETLREANEYGYQWTKEHKDIVDRIRVMANEAAYRAYDTAVENGTQKENAHLREFYKTKFDTDGELSFSDFDKLMRAMLKSFGETEKVVDTAKFESMLKEKVDKEAYNTWLTDLFSDIIEKEGIRNNVDFFTPSGNRRSWDALHLELTLENVVRAMKSEAKQGAAGFLAGQNIWGVATKRFKSIAEMRKEIARLVHQNEEERDAQRSEFTEKLVALANDIMYKGKGSNSFIEHDRAAEAIVDSLRGAKNVNAINRSLREWTTLNIKEDTAQKILDLYNEIMVMPTDYFEAKPARAVGLDEIAYVIIPSDSSKELTDALDGAGITYHTYEYSDSSNADRVKVTNENATDDVLFNLKSVDETYYMSQSKLNFTTNTDAVRERIRKGDYVIADTGEGVASTDLGIIYFGGTSNNLNVNRVVKLVETFKDKNNKIDLRKDAQAQEIWLKTEEEIKNGKSIKEDIFITNLRSYMSKLRNGTVRIVGYSAGNSLPFRGSWGKIRRSSSEIMDTLERDILYRSVYDKSLADAGDKNQLAIKELISANTGVDKSLFSDKVDSDGNKLSVGQEEYFKNSLARDKGGNLLLVYHGSPNEFSIFDRKKAKGSGTYGNGFYFSTSKGHAGTYGKLYSGYLNIENPVVEGRNTITKEQLTKFVRAIADNEDYGIENYGREATVKSVVDSLKGKDDFAILLDLNATCIGNMAEALEYFNEINGTDFDGIIAPTELVVLSSEQFKSKDNLNPTKNPDIYLSDKEDEDYLSAVNSGDMETADKLVRAAAKNAGYDSPRLYHGTGKFGFKRFSMSETKHNAIFTTETEQVARSYSGVTTNSEIKDSTEIDFWDLSNEELLEYAKEKLDSSYRFITSDENHNRNKADMDIVRKHLKKYQDYNDDNLNSADKELYKILDKAERALAKMVHSNTWLEFSERYGSYTEAVWDLKWYFEDKGMDIPDALKEDKGFGNATLLLSQRLGLSNDNFITKDGSTIEWTNSLIDVLNRKYKRGIYNLYGKTSNMLEYDAKGENWNSIGVDESVDETFRKAIENRWGLAYSTNDLVEEAIRQGYDGIVIKNVMDSGGGVLNAVIPQTERIYFNPKNLKSADTVTYDDNGQIIPLSQRFNEETDDIRYSEKENDIFDNILADAETGEKYNDFIKNDLANFANALILTNAKGKTVKDSQIERIANILLKDADSAYDKEKLKSLLKETYDLVVSFANNENEISYDVVMTSVYDMAQRIMSQVKTNAVDDYYKGVLNRMRHTKVRLDEAQKAEAKNIQGTRYNNLLFGKVTLSKDGMSLDEAWQAWAAEYPEIFNKDINSADQVSELVNIYEDISSASKEVQAITDEDAIRWMAEDIYQKLWNLLVNDAKAVQSVDTNILREVKKQATAEKNQAVANQRIADDIYYGKKLSKQAKNNEAVLTEIKAQHRQAMKELSDIRKNQLEKLRTADDIYYGKKLNELRKRKDAELQRYKEYQKEKQAERKDAAARMATIEGIKEVSTTLMDWMKGKKRNVPEPLKAPIGTIIEAIDFSSKQLLGLQKGIKAYTPTSRDISIGRAVEQMRDVVAASQDAQANPDKGNELDNYIDFPPEFANTLNELSEQVNDIERTAGQQFVLEMMSLDELKELHNALKIMKHSVMQMNSIISAANRQEIAYYGQETMREANEAGEKSKYNTAAEKLKNFMDYDNGLPYYVFKHMGKGSEAMFNLLQDGWDKFAFNVKTIMDFTEGAYTSEEAQAWTKDVHTVTVLEPMSEEDRQAGVEPQYRDIQVTSAQLMSLYCLQKRDQARGHILGGGIRIADFTDKYETISQVKPVRLTVSELDRLCNEELTDRQREVADTLQEFMNTVCSQWGNEVTMKRFGIKGFTEKYYFPIKSDSNVLRADVRDDAQSIYALLNMSFTKALVKNANNQIVVDDIFKIFTIHSSDMAKYNSMALPVLDVIRWWNYKEKYKTGEGTIEVPSVKTSLSQAYGSGANKYIRDLLMDINGSYESGRYDKTINKFAKRSKIASVGANLSVALLQPISFVRARYAMPAKYLLAGLRKAPSIEKCKSLSGIALWKSMGFYDTNVNMGLDKMLRHGETTVDKLVEKSMYLAELGDSLTWGFLWNACEAEISDTRKDLAYNSDAYNQAVAERLREILYSTQVFDSTLSRSDMMRSQGFAQLYTAFMSEPTVTVNMLNDARFNFMKEKKKHGLNSALNKEGKKIMIAGGTYVVTAALEAIIRGVLDELRDDDDKKNDEDVIQYILSEFKSALNPLSKIPFFKEIVNVLQGYDPSNTGLQSLITNYGYTIKAIEKAISDGKFTYKTFYRILTSVGQTIGLPLSNAMRELATIWNESVGQLFPDLKLKK